MKQVIARLDPVHARRVRVLGTIAARSCFAVELVVVVGGWLGGIDVLKSFVPGYAAMKMKTALGFAASGLALALVDAPPSSPGAHRLARATTERVSTPSVCKNLVRRRPAASASCGSARPRWAAPSRCDLTLAVGRTFARWSATPWPVGDATGRPPPFPTFEGTATRR